VEQTEGAGMMGGGTTWVGGTGAGTTGAFFFLGTTGEDFFFMRQFPVRGKRNAILSDSKANASTLGFLERSRYRLLIMCAPSEFLNRIVFANSGDGGIQRLPVRQPGLLDR